MNYKFWLNLFLVLAGTVIGSMVARVCEGVKYLSWLSYGLRFGTSNPVNIELGVVNCTFGINFYLSVATILFIIIALIVGNLVVKR